MDRPVVKIRDANGKEHDVTGGDDTAATKYCIECNRTKPEVYKCYSRFCPFFVCSDCKLLVGVKMFCNQTCFDDNV
jgi:hypothetical protein